MGFFTYLGLVEASLDGDLLAVLFDENQNYYTFLICGKLLYLPGCLPPLPPPRLRSWACRGCRRASAWACTSQRSQSVIFANINNKLVYNGGKLEKIHHF